MNNSRHERLQDLEKELGIIRSLIDRFWHECKNNNIIYQTLSAIVKQIRFFRIINDHEDNEMSGGDLDVHIG